MSAPTAPKPHVTLATAASMVVATMIGSGVFVSLGYQVGPLPSGFPILVLWAVGGIISLCGALSYAELAAMMPRSGGEYHLLGQAYHPLVGFLAGWVSIFAGFSAPIAGGALLFGLYTQAAVPGWNGTALSIGLLVSVTVIQLAGLRSADRFQVTSTVLKLLLILLFLAGAICVGGRDWSLLAPKEGDLSLLHSAGFAGALVYVMYAYTGWNTAVYVAGEMVNVKRNLPLALLLGTFLVMLLYVGLNAIFLVGAPWSDFQGTENVAVAVGLNLFGPHGGKMVAALIAFGLIAHVNSMLLAGARVMQVIGQDAPSLRGFARCSRTGVPWVSILFMSVLALTMVMGQTFAQLVSYIQVLLLLSSLMAVLAVPWMRRKRPELPRPFKTPLYPLPPLIFSGATIWMLYVLAVKSPWECLWGLLTLLVGTGVYFLAASKAPKII